LTRGGVFERFKDPSYFGRFRVDEEAGTLAWDGEVAIAPESLYAQATGKGLPAWMEPDEGEAANQRLQSDGLQPSAFGHR